MHVQVNKEPQKQVGAPNKSSLLVHEDSTIVTLGLFESIRPTIKYQPGKANVVTDALSQS